MSSIITFPTVQGIGFQSATLKLTRKSVVMRSPFTGKTQALAYPYALWVFSGKITSAQEPAASAWRSFITQLQGQVNKFRLPVPGYLSGNSGYAGPAGLVNGANQTGSSLITDGWTASALIFKDGDYFTINDELKTVVGDTTANGSGQVTINFMPALHYSPADNLALIIVNPTVMLRLSADDIGWDLSPPVIHNIQIDAIESLE